MDATLARTQILIIIAAILIHLVVLTWDMWAIFSGHEQHTISSVIRQWSKAYPFLPLMVGVLVGHLFF